MSPDEVLEFWFGTPDPAGDLSDAAFARFWKKDEAFDTVIRERFGAVHGQASRGELDAWGARPRGRRRRMGEEHGAAARERAIGRQGEEAD